MALRIEDYALIGDTQSVALVGRDGSIDWLCLPRVDSGACLAALLGTSEHGRWLISPREEASVSRRYRDGALVLETTFRTARGAVRLVDCMPPREGAPDLVRVVEGVEGEVAMRLELVLRFDYGSIVPWVRRLRDGAMGAVAGPDALTVHTPVALEGRGLTTAADFVVRAGERVPFVLTWYPSHERPPTAHDGLAAVADTVAWWHEWTGGCSYRGPQAWREAVETSLRVLKALTYAPTGGIVAAASMALPEWPGGVRNWDYRYCWLRDAAFTLDALIVAGYRDEAGAFRDWLLRAAAGDPSRLQIMYGVAGERRLDEYEVPWLPGYEGSRPVRVGNAAAEQLQLDVYGELMDGLHQARREGLPPDENGWRLQRALLEWLEGGWQHDDEGLWEMRGPRQHFTHSKVMAWVAFDRAVKAVEHLGAEGPVERWRRVGDAIHADVCARGFDRQRGAFMQAYGSPHLDASLLLLPQVGFLPASDPRVRGTVQAIERDLMRDGFVRRYLTQGQDGLPGEEAAFLACSFWLADAYILLGREREARDLFERLLAVRNDVGLLAEEYDPVGRRQLGNFPQAFSHVGLINTAYNLTPEHRGPAVERSTT
jgi:GH15 family glucan-1,4-alpha-glucosidase